MTLTTTEVPSAPVTPDSVVGASIKTTASFNDTCIDQHFEQRITGSPNPSDEVLLSMINHESLPYYQVSADYLNLYSQGYVTEKCRRRTCEWMYHICDYFQLNREVVAIAAFYVDRYFTLTYCQDIPTTRQFQLVAIASLFIAIKTHGETKHPEKSERDEVMKFNIDFCACISRGKFSTQEIEQSERAILHTLEWHVNPVVPLCVINALFNYLSPLLKASEEHIDIALYIYDCSRHLAELAVSVPALVMVYKPSVIAFSSIMYALHTFGGDNISTQQVQVEFESALREVSCYHYDEVKENIKGTIEILRAICPDLSEQLQ